MSTTGGPHATVSDSYNVDWPRGRVDKLETHLLNSRQPEIPVGDFYGHDLPSDDAFGTVLSFDELVLPPQISWTDEGLGGESLCPALVSEGDLVATYTWSENACSAHSLAASSEAGVSTVLAASQPSNVRTNSTSSPHTSTIVAGINGQLSGLSENTANGTSLTSPLRENTTKCPPASLPVNSQHSSTDLIGEASRQSYPHTQQTMTPLTCPQCPDVAFKMRHIYK